MLQKNRPSLVVPEHYAEALRELFGESGRTVVFEENTLPLDRQVYEWAVGNGLLIFRYGTGWSIHESMSLTRLGRDVLGYPKQSWWMRFKASLGD